MKVAELRKILAAYKKEEIIKLAVENGIQPRERLLVLNEHIKRQGKLPEYM